MRASNACLSNAVDYSDFKAWNDKKLSITTDAPLYM